MPERFARITALVLIVVLILALPLLISLFGALNAPASTPTLSPTLIALATATATLAPPTPTNRPAIPTDLPTLTPSPSPTPGCPIPATPEPLWVNPVLSPTNQLSQTVSVTLGRGREISVTSEAGTFTQQGEFSTATPVQFQIPLVQNAENHLLVAGKVEHAPGCFYTLETRIDRTGNPLVIVQSSGVTPPPTTFVPTPPPAGTVYLQPFSQVFARDQVAPSPADQLFLYTGESNGAFQVLGQEGAFVRLGSQGGTLNFWTLSGNVVPTPGTPPQYDNTVAGQPVEFVSSSVFACEAQYPTPLILGLCSELPNVTDGEVLERAQVDSSVLYLVRINNRLYWVSSNVLRAEPP